MMQAAFYAGVAITCSGTTAVHALSYPLAGGTTSRMALQMPLC